MLYTVYIGDHVHMQVTFQGNTAFQQGGALNLQGCSATFNGPTLFTNNKAERGGAIAAFGTADSPAVIDINGPLCAQRNTATTEEVGAGFAFIRANVSISIADPDVVNIANNRPFTDFVTGSVINNDPTASPSISCAGSNATTFPLGSEPSRFGQLLKFNVTGSLCGCVSSGQLADNGTCNTCDLGFDEATCACKVCGAHGVG